MRDRVDGSLLREKLGYSYIIRLQISYRIVGQRVGIIASGRIGRIVIVNDA